MNMNKPFRDVSFCGPICQPWCKASYAETLGTGVVVYQWRYGEVSMDIDLNMAHFNQWGDVPKN